MSNSNENPQASSRMVFWSDKYNFCTIESSLSKTTLKKGFCMPKLTDLLFWLVA